MNPLSWLLDHTIGWLFDHTIGLMAERIHERTAGRQRRRDDLAALADTLADAVGQCASVWRGYVANETFVTKARVLCPKASALTTRIADDDLTRLTRLTTDAIGAFLEDRGGNREPYTKAYTEVSDRITALQKALR